MLLGLGFVHEDSVSEVGQGYYDLKRTFRISTGQPHTVPRIRTQENLGLLIRPARCLSGRLPRVAGAGTLPAALPEPRRRVSALRGSVPDAHSGARRRREGNQRAPPYGSPSARRLQHSRAAPDRMAPSGHAPGVMHTPSLPAQPDRCLPRHRGQHGAASDDIGRGGLARAVAEAGSGLVGVATGAGHAHAAELAGGVRGPHRGRGPGGLDQGPRGRVHPGASGDRGGAGHARVLDGDDGRLPWPGAQGADPGCRAGGSGRQRCRPPGRYQEGDHGRGRRGAAGRDRVAAGSAARSGSDISRGL